MQVPLPVLQQVRLIRNMHLLSSRLALCWCLHLELKKVVTRTSIAVVTRVVTRSVHQMAKT